MHVLKSDSRTISSVSCAKDRLDIFGYDSEHNNLTHNVGMADCGGALSPTLCCVVVQHRHWLCLPNNGLIYLRRILRNDSASKALEVSAQLRITDVHVVASSYA